jgi:NDP-sugar pyrophosphorylase family protein
MQIIIPMTGLGKRFSSAGYKEPKPLILVDGKPMIQHVIELFPNETNILILYNQSHTDVPCVIHSFCPTAKCIPLEYTGKGPVETVLRANEFIDKSGEVIVSYCDYGTKWDYKSFLDTVHNKHADGAIACYKGFHPHNLGPDMYAFVKEENMFAQEIREKRNFTSNKLNEFASNGTYYFRTGELMNNYFSLADEYLNGELYVSLVYNKMIRDGRKIVVFEIEKMLQWGTPRDLEEYKFWSNYFHELSRRRTHISGITVLPMAGRGNRFRMVGYDTPKPFLPMKNTILAKAALNDLPTTDVVRIVSLEEHNAKPYFPTETVIEIKDVTDGQATTCFQGIFDISYDTPLLFSACDNGAMYDPDMFDNMVRDSTIDVIVWCFTNKPLYPNMYAWLDVDNENTIHDVSIKKTFENKPNTHAIIGTFYFRSKDIFVKGYNYIKENNIRTNGELYIDNMIKPLIDMGYKVKAFPVDYYICWGTPNDYRTYNYWSDYHSTQSKHNQ